MDTTTLLIIIVVLLLLGGGWYGRGRWYQSAKCFSAKRDDATESDLYRFLEIARVTR